MWIIAFYNPSVTASRATSLYTREAFCLSASAHLLTTEGVCVIEYFTAESNRLVAPAVANNFGQFPVETPKKQKGCHSGARPPEDITLIFCMRWAVDAIESLYVALRIAKRRPTAPKSFVKILSLTLQNDTTEEW